ncbi:MAG: histidine kinase [Alphaproteobacteria bacterium CG_4_9_14_3_um_filter_47_13]|nr:MAG: histidine kinase [Alphaproteobacteria bacterium CG_4_9_14_3_um_filter_47_13]
MKALHLKSKNLKSQNLSGQKRHYAFFMALILTFFLCFSAPSTAKAQNQKNIPSSLILSAEQDHYKLGTYLYITRDPGKSLTFENYKRFVESHLSEPHGETIKGNILNLGTENTPFWIILPVSNQSWADKWILSFGQHMEGRYGLIDELFVYDHMGKITYINTLKTGKPYAEEPGNFTLPITIPRGKKTLLFIYIVPKAGFPTTIVPELTVETAYMQKIASPFTQTALISYFFITMIGFFLATVLIKKMWSGIIFSLYYLILLFLLKHQNDALQISLSLAPHIPGILFNASIILGLLITKIFLDIGSQKRQQGNLIIVQILILLVSAGAATLAIPDHSQLQIFLMYVLPVLVCAFLFILSLAQGYTGKTEGYYLALGWLAVFSGAIVVFVSLSNIFTPTAFMLDFYWYGLVIQGLLFIAATYIRLITKDHLQRTFLKENQKKQEALRNIMASKEASENVRLLRMIEYEREVMNELRAREVKQNEEMRKAKEAADLANNAKSAFLAVVSHEIRTPMSGIMGMVRFLLDTNLDAKQKDYARTLQDSGDAMMSLLNDILDFEKIESGKMDIEHIDFDLHRLINGVKTLMSGHAEARNIYFKVDIDPSIPRYVIGDPVRLRQVLLNLTGNSIKFTGQGGVTLRIKPEPSAKGLQNTKTNQTTHRIRISIEDTGVGISKEAQKNLFNPFSQADSTVARKFGGTGLGLAISQKLIEAMGGHIAINSTEGHGSTFFFTLVMESGNAETVEKAEISGAINAQKPTKSLKILIVEDNEINQKLMKELVDRMGHQTSVANSGEDALKIVEEQELDLILMDVQLSGITGMGATKAIRAIKSPEKAAIPVIALTGNVKDEDVRQCYAANMNGHLSKPVDPKKLRDQIQKVIENRLDNPVELPDSGKDQHTTITRINVGAEKFGDSSPLPFQNQTDDDETEENELFNRDEIAPISALAMSYKKVPPPSLSEEDLDEDSFETALSLEDNTEQTPEPDYPDKQKTLDSTMLKGLVDSVGSEKFEALVGDMLSKANEILESIHQAFYNKNMDTLAAEMHDLKGMSGNFGLTALSKLASDIATATKNNDQEALQKLLQELPSVYGLTKRELHELVEIP